MVRADTFCLPCAEGAAEDRQLLAIAAVGSRVGHADFDAQALKVPTYLPSYLPIH